MIRLATGFSVSACRKLEQVEHELITCRPTESPSGRNGRNASMSPGFARSIIISIRPIGLSAGGLDGRESDMQRNTHAFG